MSDLERSYQLLSANMRSVDDWGDGMTLGKLERLNMRYAERAQHMPPNTEERLAYELATFVVSIQLTRKVVNHVEV